MNTKIVEYTDGTFWGKFMVARFDESEWSRRSHVATTVNAPLLRQNGWSVDHLWVLDLQTGQGALFRPGGSAVADIASRRIWVCPMFPLFLAWFYAHPEYWTLEGLPEVILTSGP